MHKLTPPDQLSFATALEQLSDVVEAFSVIGFETDPETKVPELYIDNHAEHYLTQSAEMLREVITQGRQIMNNVRDAVEAKEMIQEGVTVS